MLSSTIAWWYIRPESEKWKLNSGQSKVIVIVRRCKSGSHYVCLIFSSLACSDDATPRSSLVCDSFGIFGRVLLPGVDVRAAGGAGARHRDLRALETPEGHFLPRLTTGSEAKWAVLLSVLRGSLLAAELSPDQV